MLRNGGTAVRRHTSQRQRGSGDGDGFGVAYPSSWSLPLTIGVELLAGFLSELISDEELDGYRRGDDRATAALGAYVRGIRATMAVGLPPIVGTKVERVSAGECPAVWLTPPRLATGRTVMWMHGGAFILCNTATHARLLSSLGAAADARVLSVEYPLSPDEGDYGDMLAQVTAAYRWLTDPAGGGVVPEDVIVGGDSAGGHLALGLVHALRDDPVARQPAGVVLMSPWLDPGREHPRTSESWSSAEESTDYLRGVEHVLGFVSEVVFGCGAGGGGGRGEKTQLPRNLLRRELWENADLPPVLVQYGGAEVLAGEARVFGEVAKAVAWNVELEEWEGMPHVFQVFDSVAPEGASAINSAAAFISRAAAAASKTAAPSPSPRG